jgi:hypothetical protein
MANTKFLIRAETKGGLSSDSIPVELGVCNPGSLVASPSPIDEVIERYTTTDEGLPNVFIYPFSAWSQLFDFGGCRACSRPSFEIQDASGAPTTAPIRIDEELNILIKTSFGLKFNGKLTAFFDGKTDPACFGLNPNSQSIPVNLEICGNE